ncbi:MAG: hypothetical protein OQK42_01285 [Sedimenticola sp.]|nr:hypothetical protein [Sedimenticola sp.]MCW8882209.1 hypothetical protein [Sedimenticola sp.]MCW8948300.1 hypothetical protein [Sedimenticola sp.]MCW8948939.1 hypothetical protein [Sedimenticola sp.]MCW8974717.1 hypothetical protein [Sedimenticola sp.]
MAKEDARIPASVECLDIDKLRVTLISTVGAHCDVWQTAGYHFEKEKNRTFDVVIKRHTLSCSPMEAKLYRRDYAQLKNLLHDIIPEAIFVRTRIDGEHNIVVFARAFTPWFNLANPAVAEDAIPLMAKLPKARRQLGLFIEAVKRIRTVDHKVIDLYGLDNLVLDKNKDVRYLDSFEVFFHEDMLYIIDDPCDDLREKINVSLRRLEYLEDMLAKATALAKKLAAETKVTTAP